MRNGTIARIRQDKGFGFIRDTDAGIEYFFHASKVTGNAFASLVIGDNVQFEPLQSDKGWRATDVTPLFENRPRLT